MKRLFIILILVAGLCWHPTIPTTATADSHTPGNGYIVKLGADKGEIRASAKRIGRAVGNRENLRLVKNEVELEELEAIAQIEYIEENLEVSLFDAPAITPEQWHLGLIRVERAWALGCFGNEVRIGVIDSGVSNHAALKGTVLTGYNYINDNANTEDRIGHGTFVSGLITAKTGGAAFGAKIVPLKCFDQGQTTYLDTIVVAIYDAIDLYDCSVINMSFGLAADSRTLSDAVTYATNAGAVLVAAVGNDGTQKMYYPAGYNNVIGVGSVDAGKRLSSFSQFNTSVFVTAPGEGISGLALNGGYRIDGGTSYATPLVSALVAIARCVDLEIDTETAKQLLRDTSEDLGTPGYDVEYGYGLVDAERLMNKLLEGTDVFVSPPTLNASGEANVTVYNNSDEAVTCTSVFAAFANGVMVDAQQLVPLSLSPHETVLIPYAVPVNSNLIRHFLWQSTSSMNPLTPARDLVV